MHRDKGTILWWGRFDANYSRNRILRKLMQSRGWTIRDFQPKSSALADIEASLVGIPQPDVVWVPCFRQRDLAAAARWSRRKGAPLIFDPLISAYDKQVDERRKFPADSPKAKRLLAWERRLFGLADRVIADTPSHADYFHQVLGVPRERLSVLMVGAEEALFLPCPAPQVKDAVEALFFGSFIPLQGPDVIVEAARLCPAENVTWTLLGDGPLRAHCEQLAKGLSNVRFEDWLPYERLPERICQADILLGIFGDTPKAGRVIPNKVYQALACARPVVTRASQAYPVEPGLGRGGGIHWVGPRNPGELADTIASLSSDALSRNRSGSNALEIFRQHFSSQALEVQLAALLDSIQ